MGVNFEWDPRKAESNFKKHNIEFEEAITVFTDPLACIFFDEHHSSKEVREIIIGRSRKNRLLLVSFVERPVDRIRVISARRSTARERKDYEENQRF